MAVNNSQNHESQTQNFLHKIWEIFFAVLQVNNVYPKASEGSEMFTNRCHENTESKIQCSLMVINAPLYYKNAVKTLEILSRHKAIASCDSIYKCGYKSQER